jgi:hypothetical protein
VELGGDWKLFHIDDFHEDLDGRWSTSRMMRLLVWM